MIDDTIGRAADALRASGIKTARLDAELLFQYVLGINQTEFLAMADRELSPAEQDTYFSLVERRQAREPLQYITGEAAFRHLNLRVTPDVLVPRPETEWVAEEAIVAVRNLHKPAVLDIGTGSGAIAISIASEVPQAEVVATDISRQAVSLALENAERHNVDGRIRFIVSDYFSSVPAYYKEHFNVIVSNPPYIASHELPGLDPEIKYHEPVVALSPGLDPLAPHRIIAAGAPRFLKAGGLLVLEIGANSGQAARDALAVTGLYTDVEILLDLAGRDRVIKGVLK
ncbi:MAG: peptide chain release factor N(5)-glutamine methyltransferase [Actinomycetota bacterium]